LKEFGDIEIIDINIINQLLPLTETRQPESSPQHPSSIRHPASGIRSFAYIIYTSGSTGQPKGVPIMHANISPLLHWGYGELGLGRGDRAAQNLSYYFDWSVWEIFFTLTSGAQLHMVTRDIQLNPEEYVAFMNRQNISVLHMTPTQYHYIMNATQRPGNLKYLFLGAEKLTGDLLERSLHSVKEDCRVFNMYGPTEATIIAAVQEIHRNRSDEYHRHSSVPIGGPVGNTALLVLDKNLKPCPINIEGELYIAGDGLAAGYLNNQELTAELFVKAGRQLAPVTGGIYYRTGDRVRWLSGGNIEFLGRVDHQVKIRGFRIEMGEIENRLLAYPEIKEAVVQAREAGNGDAFLCGYYVVEKKHPAETGSQLETAIRDYLSQYLPDYMIPSYLVELDKIPLSPNGKIELNALPEPEIKATAQYEAPAGPTEEALAEVWRQVLNIDKPGVNDNYFQLGGDSIKTIQIATRLRKYDLKLEVKDTFNYQTIKQLAPQIKRISRQSEQEAVEGTVPLTPVQKWFFLHSFSNRHHFNQNVIIYREEGFDETLLKNVFTKIVRHHDALRMVYKEQEGTTAQADTTILQQNRGTQAELFHLETIELKNYTEKEIKKRIPIEANRIQAGIHLEKGPLLKLALFKTTSADHLLIVIHHLVVDGVSWRILLEDIQPGLKQALHGEPLVLPRKTDSFKYWSEKMRHYAAGEYGKQLFKEIKYWETIENTEIPPIPVDREINADQRKRKHCQTVTMNLDKTETANLLKKANRAYGTNINEILL
ncbi:MAG: AMP-binding protein, partial [bacterium]|nr:AMP-binding protein [bacterium]